MAYERQDRWRLTDVEVPFKCVLWWMMKVGAAALIVGGNIRGATRTLTTYIALEYDRGDDARAIALGLILLAVALLTNSVMHVVVGER